MHHKFLTNYFQLQVTLCKSYNKGTGLMSCIVYDVARTALRETLAGENFGKIISKFHLAK